MRGTKTTMVNTILSNSRREQLIRECDSKLKNISEQPYDGYNTDILDELVDGVVDSLEVHVVAE